MKNIAVFTATRAEYGLLFPLLKKIQADDDLNLRLLVSGTHLSPEFNLTWQQIEEDGFQIDEKIEMLLSSDTAAGVAKSIGLAVLGFTDALVRGEDDCIVILGDRFEALAMAQTALILRLPVVHLHGGETTAGAYDDALRHAITKLSQIHFTSTEQHRRRVIQLGEDPDRVFNVGATGLDNIVNAERMTFDALNQTLAGRIRQPYFLVTYHPATLANEDPQKTFGNLIAALSQFDHYQVIITWPGADDGGRAIIAMIKQWEQRIPEKVIAIPSLGWCRYLSAVSYAMAVIGNSSSGIIEAPSLRVATVNIGSRQQGRTAADSVIHCTTTIPAIAAAVRDAINRTAELKISPVINPYGNGNAAEKITEILKHSVISTDKVFYDIN